MEINKIKKQHFIYIAIILYYTIVYFAVSGEILEKVLKALISPIYILGEACFFLMPVTFLFLIILSVIQHIRKDNVSLNWLFAVLSLITLYGYVYDAYWYLWINRFPFLKIDLVSLGIITSLLWLGIVAVYRIFKNGNTHYYLYVALSMIIFCILYLLKVVYIGI